MSQELKRTYSNYLEWEEKSKQTEYTEKTPLLDADGNLLAKGWARHNVFDYERSFSKPNKRKKEWDFYQISDGRYMVQISFANISIGGYAAAKIIDLIEKKVIVDDTEFFLGGDNKYILPSKGDTPNFFKARVGNAVIKFDTKHNSRTLYFKGKKKDKVIECEFNMDIMPGLENITTVLPFKDMPTKYFMTTKQNCMPCEGTFKYGDDVYEFT